MLSTIDFFTCSYIFWYTNGIRKVFKQLLVIPSGRKVPKLSSSMLSKRLIGRSHPLILNLPHDRRVTRIHPYIPDSHHSTFIFRSIWRKSFPCCLPCLATDSGKNIDVPFPARKKLSSWSEKWHKTASLLRFCHRYLEKSGNCRSTQPLFRRH